MFICLDLETTGLNPATDHLIEVAVVRFDHEKILEEWSTLVRPPVPLPEFTKRLTGITDAMVQSAPELDDILPTLREKIGDAPIMGHFIFFDTNFLRHHGLDLPNPTLDTCQLTQLLLPNEPSYSLEVLTKKWAITQEDAHRAMDDVKANIELFWKLSGHLKALSEKEKASLEPILTKSTWSWAKHLLPLLGQSGGERLHSTLRSKNISSKRHLKLKEKVSIEPPFLLEESSHTTQDLVDHALSLEGQSLLVLPNLDLIPFHEEVGMLKDPNQYINEDRLARFVQAEKLGESETLLAGKVTLWLHQSKTGEKSELRIVKEEKDLWYDICCQEHDEPKSFYKAALEAARSKKVMAIGHQHFLKDRVRKDPLVTLPENVLVGHVDQFTTTIESAWHIQLSEQRFLNELRRLKEENPKSEDLIDQLAARISILFGFLGMTLQHHGEPNDERHLLMVEAHHRNTLEWNKVSKSAESIASLLSAFGEELASTPTRDECERYLNYMSKILQSSGPVLWMTFSDEQMPIVHAFPEDTGALFKERVWKGISKLQLFCHHGALGKNFTFLKNQLGLDVQTLQIESGYPFPIDFPEKPLSKPNDPKNIAEIVHTLKQWLPGKTGDIFLAVSSKHVAEQLFYKLKSLVDSTDRKLFVQNLGGGMGKQFQMAQESLGKNFFVGNVDFMNFLLDEGMELSHLILRQLPFRHPNDPIQKARCAAFDNPYQEFVLPQTMLAYYELLDKFLGNNWEGKSILVLDPRVDQMS